MGRYSCIAENAYGKIEAHASIGLLRSRPPVIKKEPKSSIIHLGKSAKFDCKADGEPKPTITWFFDGSEILLTQNNKHYWVKL